MLFPRLNNMFLSGKGGLLMEKNYDYKELLVGYGFIFIFGVLLYKEANETLSMTSIITNFELIQKLLVYSFAVEIVLLVAAAVIDVLAIIFILLYEELQEKRENAHDKSHRR